MKRSVKAPNRVEAPLINDRRILYVAIFLVWSGLAYFAIRQSYFTYLNDGREPHLGGILLYNLPDFYLWALLTPVILKTAARFPLMPFRWPHLSIHLLLGPGVVALHGLLASLVIAFLYIRIFDPEMAFANSFLGLARRFLGGGAGGLVTYGAILGIDHGFRIYRHYRQSMSRLSRIEAQLTRARLQALRMQLHPHFLFNTLNTISSLMRLDVDKADQMIAKLSDFLRMTLDEGTGATVPLKKELQFVRAYLEIEQIRFHDRLQITLSVADGLEDTPVPYLILQPLAENAVRHGIAPHSHAGFIGIEAFGEADRLVLTIRDDGPGPPAEAAEGIGLSNTRSRLGLLYGENFSMTTGVHADGGFTVRLKLPLTLPPRAGLSDPLGEDGGEGIGQFPD